MIEAKKTKIMYKAFLPSIQSNRYLSVVIENGLIEHKEMKRTYRKTEKSLHILDLYKQLVN